MNLIEIGHGIILIGHVAKIRDWRNVAIHRIDAFKHDKLRARRIKIGKLALEITRIIMFENELFAAGMAYALDHGGMVAFIRDNHAIRHASSKRAKARPIRHIARGKEQRRFLAVKRSKFALKQHMLMRCAGNIARTTCTRTRRINGAMHGFQHFRVLTHAQIIIRAPDGDGLLAVRSMPSCLGEGAGDAFEISENAIAAFATEFVDLG